MIDRTITQKASTPAASFTPVRNGLLQCKCACGGTPGPTGECEACRKKRLQRKARNSECGMQAGSLAPPIVHEVLRSPGQPLDATTRAFMEPRFGHDFGHVRVHAGVKAADSARAVGAGAYTVGQNIVFNRGAYAPSTTSGRALIAHELAHVVQQSSAFGSIPSSGLQIDPSVSAERDAREVASRVINPGSVGLASSAEAPQLQRLAGSLQRGGKDKCSGAGASCASGDDCLTPDREPQGPASAWALAVNVDTERDDWESALIHQEFGHTHVTFRENSGRQFSYGFYPASELPNENKRSVPGCVHHPDRTHDKCIDNRINYSLTKTQYDLALGTAQKICKDRHVYGATYTCTTFAADVATAAGQNMPSSRSAKTTVFYQDVPEIDNPNTLNENITKAKAKDPQKKGFWNTTNPPVIRLKPVEPIALSDDPDSVKFTLDWIPVEGGIFRWRLYDGDGRHYLMRGAEGDHEILDFLSFTDNKSALIGRKTRDLLKQRNVTSGWIECSVRFPIWADQHVRLSVEFTP